MSAIDDGGPAFPLQEQHSWNGELIQDFDPGMSLRAYIAVHRPAPEEIGSNIAGALLGRQAPGGANFDQAEEFWLAHAQWEAEAKAAYSVMQADALIAALKAMKP